MNHAAMVIISRQRPLKSWSGWTAGRLKPRSNGATERAIHLEGEGRSAPSYKGAAQPFDNLLKPQETSGRRIY